MLFNFSKFYGLNLMDMVMDVFTMNLENYNNLVFFVEFMIIIIVSLIMFFSFWNKFLCLKFNSWVMLEIIWTFMPIFVLIFMGIPSLKNLYSGEALASSSFNLKIIGHQWYWSYSFPEMSLFIESFLYDSESIYLYGESEWLVLPFKYKISSFLSAHDVIHAWTLPSLGLKMDAIPGRLNFFSFMSRTPGVLIGQCSELCGAYHAWMPIYLEFTSLNLFVEWLVSELLY